jgi:hypothetical protein
MTPELKKSIHDYATGAALEKIPTSHACPYPAGSTEWLEFQAAYRLAGLPTSEQRIAFELYSMASEALGMGL